MFQSGKPDIGWLLLGVAMSIGFALFARSYGGAARILWRRGRRHPSIGTWLKFAWEGFWAFAMAFAAAGSALMAVLTAFALIWQSSR